MTESVNAETAAAQRRINAKSTATSIVVGLLVARLEEISPGSREKLRSQAAEMAEHFVADGQSSSDTIGETLAAIEVLLGVSNT